MKFAIFLRTPILKNICERLIPLVISTDSKVVLWRSYHYVSRKNLRKPNSEKKIFALFQRINLSNNFSNVRNNFAVEYNSSLTSFLYNSSQTSFLYLVLSFLKGTLVQI